MSQQSRVLRLLRARGEQGISPVDFAAPEVVDGGKPIMRVAARIYDLRADGFEILERRDPNGVARYELKEARVERVVATVAPTACDGPLEPGLFDTSTFNTRRSWEDAA